MYADSDLNIHSPLNISLQAQVVEVIRNVIAKIGATNEVLLLQSYNGLVATFKRIAGQNDYSSDNHSPCADLDFLKNHNYIRWYIVESNQNGVFGRQANSRQNAHLEIYVIGLTKQPGKQHRTKNSNRYRQHD